MLQVGVNGLPRSKMSPKPEFELKISLLAALPPEEGRAAEGVGLSSLEFCGGSERGKEIQVTSVEGD